MRTATSSTSVNPPIRSEWIALDTADGVMPAYLVRPPAGDGPGLLLLQEIFGVNPHIRGVAEQYALAGFTVLAPDLFWRLAPRVELGYVGAERDRAIELMKQLTREQAVGDMQAAIDWLRQDGASSQPQPRRVGAIGYCMGGRLAYTAAALCGVDRAVAYYGGGIAGQLELAAQIRVPLQFHHAEQDASIPPDAVRAVEAAMAQAPAAAQAATRAEFYHYPGAQHGFNCWARAAYHPASAALALGRSLTFLAALF